ncbi:winged helix-turn-helix domain-containing protein [Rhodococcus opacus]|uniref:winged helix-turn-helix domain-containing protein n=1 Tax=Rhodococcus opacus TaxID=37919 RepID=UPI00055D042C|nr:winged helix-turn-helix domain-containing protein [Rhodococcus opacus]
MSGLQASGQRTPLWEAYLMADPNKTPNLPSHHHMAWPTLVVMKRLDRPVTNKEANQLVAAELGLSPDQVALRRGNTSRTVLDYRLAWSRTLLRGIGAIENVGPALWVITERGRLVTEEDVAAVSATMLREFVERQAHRRQG